MDVVRPAPESAAEEFVAVLPARLLAVVDTDGLLAATAVDDVDGVVRHVDAVSPVEVVLALDPPIDVVRCCGWWGVERPIGVSGDVHQDRWWVCETGTSLPDPHRRRVAADQLVAGPWWLRARLARRPGGPLPTVAAGASPAYDLTATGGELVEITIRRR